MAADPTNRSFQTRNVDFSSDGFRLRGTLRVPHDDAPGAGIVFTPGWLGLAESHATIHWLDAFADAGLTVLSFDYRGFGESEGDRGYVRPDWQIEDIRNAVTFLAAQQEVDPDRIGMFGKGGTGGGNAFLAAALDERVRCTVLMTPVADGSMWLRGMRREYEWRQFLRQVEQAERERVTTGTDPEVDPRRDIMLAAPERSNDPRKAVVDAKIGDSFKFSTAAHVLRYKPIDAAPRLSGRPVLIIGIEEDVVTPIEHARSLFEALGGPPRRLVVLRDVVHYEADRRYFGPASRLAVDWATRYLSDRTEVDGKAVDDDVIYPAPSA